jgi:hypothetical protein
VENNTPSRPELPTHEFDLQDYREMAAAFQSELQEACERIRTLEAERRWRPIETAPKVGYFLVANAIGEVASCEASRLGRLVSGKWTFGQNATCWMPLPPPDAARKGATEE